MDRTKPERRTPRRPPGRDEFLRMEPVSPALDAILAMGDMWSADTDERTELGELIGRVKDDDDSAAAPELAARLASMATELVRRSSSLVVVPVPTRPGTTAGLPATLAAAVADALGATLRDDIVRRSHDSTPLRDVDLADRHRAVEAAGYVATGSLDERTVLLVDDVVLTGVTLARVAALLRDAGAIEVIAVAAARTRRR